MRPNFDKFKKILGSCVFCAPLNRYTCISQHIARHSVNVSVDTWQICRPRCVGQHMLTDNRPICWSRCQPRVVVRLPADMSIGYWHSANTSLLFAYWWLSSLHSRHNFICVCCLITTEFAAHLNVKPSGWPKKDEMHITYTYDSVSFWPIYHRQLTDILPTINGQRIGRVLAAISTKISADSWSICQLWLCWYLGWYIGWYVDWHISMERLNCLDTYFYYVGWLCHYIW